MYLQYIDNILLVSNVIPDSSIDDKSKILDESKQAAEYDAFFNAEATADTYASTSADTTNNIFDQLVITNEMLGVMIAFFIVFSLFLVVNTTYHFLRDNIFKYF